MINMINIDNEIDYIEDHIIISMMKKKNIYIYLMIRIIILKIIYMKIK